MPSAVQSGVYVVFPGLPRRVFMLSSVMVWLQGYFSNCFCTPASRWSSITQAWHLHILARFSLAVASVVHRGDSVTTAVDAWQVFYLVPVIGICFNIFPVNNSFWFALAFTLYIFMIQVRGLPCSFL